MIPGACLSTVCVYICISYMSSGWEGIKGLKIASAV